MRTRICEVCNSGNSTVVTHYTDRDWPLVRCDHCGFVYLQQVPDYEALKHELAWEKTHAAENKRRGESLDGKLDLISRWRLNLGKYLDDRRESKIFGANGNVLDVGCGGFCRIPAGPVPFGIELSTELGRLAKPHFEKRGGSLFSGTAFDGLDAFPGVQFDAILMRSYLEHEYQPRAVLQKSRDRLKPGGKIFLRLPNYQSPNRYIMGRRWCGFRFPDHVNYFSGKTLRALTQSLGLNYRRVNALSIFDDNLQVELTKPAASKSDNAKALDDHVPG